MLIIFCGMPSMKRQMLHEASICLLMAGPFNLLTLVFFIFQRDWLGGQK